VGAADWPPGRKTDTDGFASDAASQFLRDPHLILDHRKSARPWLCYSSILFFRQRYYAMYSGRRRSYQAKRVGLSCLASLSPDAALILLSRPSLQSTAGPRNSICRLPRPLYTRRPQVGSTWAGPNELIFLSFSFLLLYLFSKFPQKKIYSQMTPKKNIQKINSVTLSFSLLFPDSFSFILSYFIFLLCLPCSSLILFLCVSLFFVFKTYKKNARVIREHLFEPHEQLFCSVWRCEHLFEPREKLFCTMYRPTMWTYFELLNIFKTSWIIISNLIKFLKLLEHIGWCIWIYLLWVWKLNSCIYTWI
jgi:hypothetical protein